MKEHSRFLDPSFSAVEKVGLFTSDFKILPDGNRLFLSLFKSL
jgi:hypothetical protein